MDLAEIREEKWKLGVVLAGVFGDFYRTTGVEVKSIQHDWVAAGMGGEGRWYTTTIHLEEI